MYLFCINCDVLHPGGNAGQGPPRGGRGRGGRYFSAPPQRGGYSRPPMTNGDRRDYGDMGPQNRLVNMLLTLQWMAMMNEYFSTL